jgi:hypothetical protein
MNKVYSGNNTKHGALPGTMKFGWEKNWSLTNQMGMKPTSSNAT